MNHRPSHWLPLICQILSVFNSPHVYWLSTWQPVQLIKKNPVPFLVVIWMRISSSPFHYQFFLLLLLFMHTSYNYNYWWSRYDACWWCMPYLMLNNSLLYWERCHCDQSCQVTLDISRRPHWFSMGPPEISRATLTSGHDGDGDGDDQSAAALLMYTRRWCPKFSR